MASAASKVFAIPELLEQILLAVSGEELAQFNAFCQSQDFLLRSGRCLITVRQGMS